METRTERVRPRREKVKKKIMMMMMIGRRGKTRHRSFEPFSTAKYVLWAVIG